MSTPINPTAAEATATANDPARFQTFAEFYPFY